MNQFKAPAQNEIGSGAIVGMKAGALAINEVLFATDFSPASQMAGMYASALAGRLAVPLTVMHVFLLTQGASEAEAVSGHASTQRQAAKNYLEKLATSLATRNSAGSSLLCEGEPSQEIERVVSDRPGVCLVLGTHGGSALGRHLIGSTAEQVLTAVSCPTLTVGPLAGKPLEGRLFSNILYATDCSQAGSRAAPLACAFSRRFGGRLRVITVVDEERGPVADILATFNFQTEQELSRTLQSECRNFHEPKTVSSPRDAEPLILSALKDEAIDLLILGLQQHDSLGFTQRNSRTFQIIARASAPVLTVTDKAFR